MKKYINIVISFALIIMLMVFPSPRIANGLQPPHVYGANFFSYDEMIECYEDNTKLLYWHEITCGDYSFYIEPEKFCELYNNMIESGMFIQFTEHPEREPEATNFELTQIRSDSCDYQWAVTFLEEGIYVFIDILYMDSEELSLLKEAGYKEWANQRYGNRAEQSKGCGGYKKEEHDAETIILNNKECDIFWEKDTKADIVYGDNVITVHAAYFQTSEDKKKIGKDYVREFLSDLVFSEYIPPEGDGGETGEEFAITE